MKSPEIDKTHYEKPMPKKINKCFYDTHILFSIYSTGNLQSHCNINYEACTFYSIQRESVLIDV